MAPFKFAKKLTKDKKLNHSNSATDSSPSASHSSQNSNNNGSQSVQNGSSGFHGQNQNQFPTQNSPNLNNQLNNPLPPAPHAQQQQPLYHMSNPQSRVFPSPAQQRNVSGASTSLSQQQKEYTPWNRIKLQNSPFPRYRHVASSNCSEENKLYVIGGLHDQSVYGDTWIISTNDTGTQFQSKTVEISETTPPPRVGHAATLCGNAFVLFGGDTHKVNSEGLMDDDLYLFNINSYKWTIPHPIGPRPLGRYGHKISIMAANQMKTKLYLFGGQFDDTYFNDLAVFDLSSFRRPDSHWEFLKPTTFSPPPLTNHTMISYDNHLWVFGGDTLQGLINQVFKYDITSNDWSIAETTGTKPPPMQEHAAVVYKHLMVVMGGKDEHDIYLNSVYFLNLKTHEWFKLPTFKAGIPQGRSGHSITLLNNDKLLIMGGDKFDFARPGEYDLNTSNTDMGRGTLLYTLDLSRLEEICPGVLRMTERQAAGFVPATPPINPQQQSKLSQPAQPNILTPYSQEGQQTPNDIRAPLQPKPSTPNKTPNIGFDNEPRERFSQFSNNPQQYPQQSPFQQTTPQQTPQPQQFSGAGQFAPQRNSPQYTPQYQPHGQPQHPYYQKGHARQPSDLKKPVSPIPELERTKSNNHEEVPRVISMGSGTSGPHGTNGPDNIDEPNGTNGPASTGEPAATATPPVDNNEPTGTNEPVGTGGPAGAEGPIETEKPIINEKSANLNSPLNTDEPNLNERPNGTDSPRRYKGRPDSMAGEIGVATVASSPLKGDVKLGNKDETSTYSPHENRGDDKENSSSKSFENGLSEPVEITKQDGSSTTALNKDDMATSNESAAQIKPLGADPPPLVPNAHPIDASGSHGSNVAPANNSYIDMNKMSSKETVNKEVIHSLRSQLEELRIITEDRALQASEHIKELEVEVQRLRNEPSRDIRTADFIKLQSHCDVMEANRDLMEDRIHELENMLTAKFADTEVLNKIIRTQSSKLESLEQELPFQEQLQELQTKYEALVAENESLKSKLAGSETEFKQSVKQYSLQLNNFMDQWREHNSLRETGELDANGHPKRELVPAGSYHQAAMQKLQQRLDDLLQTNEELTESHNKLTGDHRELTAKHNELNDNLGNHQRELKEIQNNYQEVLNSANNSSKALEMSQSELDKYKQFNKKLQNELDELKFVREPSAGNDSVTNIGIAGSNHYSMKINDLKAELYIFRQERDNLKDEVLQLKKKLLSMGEQ